jgi:sn-glycerol 3-phosphate transport system ATP-binding protein
MGAISIRNVVKRYGSGATANPVIHGVNAEIADGEFVVIVGPSGCGKSTLLRMVAGLEEVSGGEIAIGGRVVNDVEPSERDIAMVFQNYALYPHMSVFDNMAYGLRIAKLSDAEIAKRVDKAAKILELGAFLKRRPRELSGGQRQRVAMGRAIVRERSSCSTNPCRTSTRSCVPRRAWRSASCTRNSASPRSLSRTIRSRR